MFSTDTKDCQEGQILGTLTIREWNSFLLISILIPETSLFEEPLHKLSDIYRAVNVHDFVNVQWQGKCSLSLCCKACT